MNTKIETELPAALLKQAEDFIKEGWAEDLDSILAEALRRYLESHSSELAEQFIRDDVQWGLHGID